MRNHLVNEVGLDLEGLNPFPEHLHLDIDFHLTFPFACTYIIADYMEKSNEDFDENPNWVGLFPSPTPDYILQALYAAFHISSIKSSQFAMLKSRP